MSPSDRNLRDLRDLCCSLWLFPNSLHLAEVLQIFCNYSAIGSKIRYETTEEM